MIRVIACDLDGTLLTQNATPARRSGHLLHALWQQGMRVVLTTGRSWRTALKVQQALRITGPIIAHNGAYVFDTTTGLEWHRRALKMADAKRMLRFADDHEIMLRCYLGYRHPVLFNRFTPEYQRDWLRPEDCCSPELWKQLSRAPVEMFFLGSDTVFPFVDHFGLRSADYELLIFPHDHYREVNILAPGVDKVEGLEVVTKRLHVDQSQVLALGDGANDVGMLQWAGLSVAMASGVAAAQEGADYVTARPELEPVEDGLLWALKHTHWLRDQFG